MRVILFGSDGQIGSELRRSLSGFEQIKFCGKDIADLENPKEVQKLILDYSPSAIINAAGYTKVDQAEIDSKRAHLLNVEAVSMLAKTACKLNSWLIHYSTDYVFDGSFKRAYTEEDTTNPLSVYGRTKDLGEKKIRESTCNHLILRTSWVYGLHGQNFIKSILRYAKSRPELSIVNDQIGTPTSAETIAKITAKCLSKLPANEFEAKEYSGTYHLTARGNTSWYDLARYVIGLAKKLGNSSITELSKIKPILSKDYPSVARRPLNSRLNTKKLINTFECELPKWELDCQKFLQQLPEIKNNES